MILYAFLWLLFVHFIADFVLQSNWMAQNKSKDWTALSAHVLVYTSVLWFGVVLLLATFYLTPVAMVMYALANGALHFATDAVTSRINSRLWEAKRVHGFFVGVGADQFIHAFTLGISLAYLFNN